MDTQGEARELLQDAQEDLERAGRYLAPKDWVTVTHYAQLAIEKSAKAVIACFEAYEWSHDPSGQLKKLMEKGVLGQDFLEFAASAHESAPWHGQSTYGRRINGVRRRPSELCTEPVATRLYDNAKKWLEKAGAFVQEFYGHEDGHRENQG